MYSESISPLEHRLDEPTVEAYLAKLGLDSTIPRTDEGLTLIQNAHLQHIPYSTIHQFLEGPEPIQPSQIVTRIVETGHGGYCFELNSALFALLRELGLNVQRHAALIRRHPSAAAADLLRTANHTIISVRNLPTATNPDGMWLMDVGMGDGPYNPLSLSPGIYREEAFEYALKQSPKNGAWQFLHHPLGSFFDMTFDTAHQMDAQTLNAVHLKLGGLPTSRFVRNLIVELRPDANTTDTLVNCELQRRQGQLLITSELTERQDWFSALHNLFGLSLNELSESQKHELWQKVLSAHVTRKQLAEQP